MQVGEWKSYRRKKFPQSITKIPNFTYFSRKIMNFVNILAECYWGCNSLHLEELKAYFWEKTFFHKITPNVLFFHLFLQKLQILQKFWGNVAFWDYHWKKSLGSKIPKIYDFVKNLNFAKNIALQYFCSLYMPIFRSITHPITKIWRTVAFI